MITEILTPLQQKIKAARIRGDVSELVRLQAEYRMSGTHYRPGGTTRIAGALHYAEAVRNEPPASPRPARRPHVPMIHNVLMSKYTVDKLIDCAGDSENGTEQGGFLYGEFGQWSMEVTDLIVAATDRRETRATLEGAWAKELEDPTSLFRAKICGTWHTHPSFSRPEPSPTDVEAFQQLLQVDGVDRSVNLIITPGANSYSPWSKPQITPWILSRTVDGGFRTYRAFLVETAAWPTSRQAQRKPTVGRGA